jgi:subtilase family serine protease
MAWVDDVNRITESNDNNNKLTETVSVNTSSSLTPVVQIDAGSSGVAPFTADVDFNTGNEFSSSSTINLSAAANAAAAAVYQSCRWAPAFSYTIPGLTAGGHYTVRLHFAELTWTAAGQRKFNVAINGTSVLSGFDIFAAAGAQNKAVVEQFTAVANTAGQIVIGFTQAGADNPEVNGIEVLQ